MTLMIYESSLRARGMPILQGHDRWDLDVRQGSLGSARLINGDYERRCRAATAIADACFDAQLMLSEILNLVDARA